MPRTGSPIVIPPMRGSAEYAAWLDRLTSLLGRRDRSDLITLALDSLGRQHDLPPPRRVAPRGTNRYGEPRPKSGS